jgi:hypothetical protein
VLAGTLAVARAQARTGASSAAPTVTITSSPASPTTSTTATVAFVAQNASKIKCSLDGASFGSCTSPVTYNGLKIGTHSFVVKATSNGVTVKASADWEIVAAKTPPPPSGFSVVSSITDGSTLAGTLLWSATTSTPVSKVGFYIDGSLRWTEWITPYQFNGDPSGLLDTTSLTNGSHTLNVVATASDGTTAEKSASVQVSNPTTTPPALTVASSIAAGATLSGGVAWEATPNQPVSSVAFYIDGALKWTESTTPYRFNGDSGTLDTTTLANGNHTLGLVAAGTGGTTAQASATVQVSNATSSLPSPPPPPPTAGTAGAVQFMEHTSSATDSYTNNPTLDQQQWMRDHWQRAIVSTSYWDSRLSWFPNGWVYQNAYAIYNPSTLATQHPEWILKDAAGNKLYIPWGCSGSSCPQYAADIGDAGWRAYLIGQCKALIARGYKGIYLDDVDMDMNVGNAAGQHVAPLDPRTGQLMTDTAWKGYFADFMEQLRTALPGAEIVHNAVWFAGGGQHDGTNPYIVRQIQAADYVNLERGFNDGGLTGGTGSWSVYALMRYVDNVHSDGAHVIFQSYATTPTAEEYNLAGYLLVNDGLDLVNTSGGSLPGQWWSAYDTNLGDATGGRYLWNGVWRRDFTGGFVLLNEPGATMKTLALAGTFTNSSGQQVTAVSLGAAQGAVFRR